jgi:hypothetical protein
MTKRTRRKVDAGLKGEYRAYAVTRAVTVVALAQGYEVQARQIYT